MIKKLRDILMTFFTATIYKNIIYDSTALNCVHGEPVCPFKQFRLLKATL